MKDAKTSLICTDGNGRVVPNGVEKGGILFFETKWNSRGVLTTLRPVIVIPDNEADRKRIYQGIRNGYLDI